MGRSASLRLALIAIAVCLALFELSCQGVAPPPVLLRSNHQVDPIALEGPYPRFSWVMRDTRRGAVQTAYQVLVSSSREGLGREEGDLWDSGRVISDESTQVVYAGRPLHSAQRCFWKVRVWDHRREASNWSRPAVFTMGLLSPSEWEARWISTDSSEWGLKRPQASTESSPGTIPQREERAGLPLFRKTFSTTQPVRRAEVRVSGLGQFELLLDGEKVGDHFLDPAWSVYERTVYYNTFDITARLTKPGKHAFGVMLGKGFYNTQGDRRIHGVQSSRPLKLILQARLVYADGTVQTMVSDDSWQTLDGPITHSAILGGEDYDARREPVGWSQAHYDDRAWKPAVETDGPGGALFPAISPPMRRFETFRPVRIEEPQPGVFVYDFGQNASAIPRLRVRGRAGQKLKLIPAEQRHGMSPRRNDGRGLVNPAGVGTPNYFQYTLRGDREEVWEPHFTYSGFQYLQLEGAVPARHSNPDQQPVVEELMSVHVRSAAPAVGAFECSDPLLNDIDRIIQWAVRGNLAHVLTDCPHREKLGWLEVSYLMGPSIAGRFDIAGLYDKISRDCSDSQSPDGRVPTVAPAYPKFDGGFAYTPEWGAAAVVNPWLLYEWYGDRAVLDRSYHTMRGLVEYMRDTSRYLIPLAGLGDWYDYGHGKPVGASQFTPTELSAMATFYRCSRIVADTAGLLGHTRDQAVYLELARQVAAAFNQRCFNGRDAYENRGSPQTANSMALVTGLVPAGREEAVLGRIVDDIRQRGNQQTAGDIGFWYLLQALRRSDRSDVILNMVSRTNLGSYGFIVRNGWTSMPEAWDADTGASMNHCMLGHIQEWFLGGLGGIRPDPAAPGFRRFFIAPQPVGHVQWVRARYDSIRGPIRSHWRMTSRGFTLEADVPPNTRATIIMPTAHGASQIRERGRSLDRVSGVALLQQNDREVWLDVGAGSYRFEVMHRR